MEYRRCGLMLLQFDVNIEGKVAVIGKGFRTSTVKSITGEFWVLLGFGVSLH
jgi:hypothetical protein